MLAGAGGFGAELIALAPPKLIVVHQKKMDFQAQSFRPLGNGTRFVIKLF